MWLADISPSLRDNQHALGWPTAVGFCRKAIGLAALMFCGNANAQPPGENHGLDAVYLRYANDYFKATDYYFTQGIDLRVHWQQWEVYLAQDGYTPTSIADPNIRVGDRPYAGTLYSGLRYVLHGDSARTWRFGAHLGIIGPAAKGGEQQAYIHRKIGDEEPMGWRYQIANDVLVGVNASMRQWLVERRLVQLGVGSELQLSSYKTRLTAQTILRLGWPGLRLEILPAVFVPIFDATLQGGAFSNDSPYTIPTGDIRRVVGRVEVGVAARLGRANIRFAHVHLGREWSTGRQHVWGVLTVGWTGRGARRSTTPP